MRTPDGRGWRRVVASPRPIAVVEQEAIGVLLAAHHVIAGGGGGVTLAGSLALRHPQPAVVDKDWVAALLAIAFDARQLLFVTDVPVAFDRFGEAGQQPISMMTTDEALGRLAQGVFAPGSMAPKVQSAVQFVAACGRPAMITTIGSITAALRGEAGTRICP